MSTLNAASLRASTDVQTPSLKDASGLNPSTPAEIQQGRAKVWFALNGTGTIAALDSFNVSSFTDIGTGQYTATFASPRPSANFAPQISAGNSPGGNGYPVIYQSSYPQTTTTVSIAAIGTGGSTADQALITGAIDGD